MSRTAEDLGCKCNFEKIVFSFVQKGDRLSDNFNVVVSSLQSNQIKSALFRHRISQKDELGVFTVLFAKIYSSSGNRNMLRGRLSELSSSITAI